MYYLKIVLDQRMQSAERLKHCTINAAKSKRFNHCTTNAAKSNIFNNCLTNIIYIYIFILISLVVWFMAHGDIHNLKLKDGRFRKRKLMDYFINLHSWKKTPKQFYIQACAVGELNFYI